MDIENAADQIGASLFGDGGDFQQAEPATVENPTSDDSAVAGDSPVDTPAAVAEPKPEVENPEVASETPVAEKKAVPQTWRGDAAALWDSLPEKVQDEVLKREEDIFKGIEQYKNDAFLGKELKDILKPHMDLFQRYNVHPGNHIQQLLGFQRTLMEGTPEQKAQVLYKVAKDYGVQLDGFDAPYVDPATEEMRKELTFIRSQFQELTAAQQATRLQEVTQTVEKFATDSSKPYFSELINDMTELIQSKACKDLSEAYETAVWRNPSTRAKEQQRLQTEAADKLKKESAEHAARAAKTVAARVAPTSKTVSDTAPVGTMADTLAETLEKIQARNKR